jgi:hypothetical protein
MKRFFLKIRESIGLFGALILMLGVTANWLVLGCATNKKSGEVAAGVISSATEKSGAELWSDNCVRCHNIRSPGSYSPAQWETAMMHMRVRANLTPAEHKKILEFLKAGA